MSVGVRRPKKRTLGLAVSGRVVAVGSDVRLFAPGDEVYAEVPLGGFAELVCVPEAECAFKPTNATFEQAAAVPVSGVTAIQALRAGHVKPGETVLVNGASGGVGVFAVQVAKILGAEVTGVCSTTNVDLVRGLGADHVIDYTAEDFTQGRTYDLILDNVGNRSLSELRRALNPKGTLIPNSNKGEARWLGTYLRRAIGAVVTSPLSGRKARPFAARSSAADLATLTEYIEAGRVTPVIDRTYPLTETAQALGYFGEGHVRGKLIIAVDQGS
jgi:NADPH:quinone reductase-like Zn-dependent oxidoreductase